MLPSCLMSTIKDFKKKKKNATLMHRFFFFWLTKVVETLMHRQQVNNGEEIEGLSENFQGPFGICV